MTRTDAFARDVCQELTRLLPDSGEWKCSWKPSGVRGHEAVDVGIHPARRGEPCILIEAELRRCAPVVNIIKIWRWITANKIRLPLTVVQAFSGYYSPGTARRAQSEFIGQKMQEAVGANYLSVSLPYKPRKHGKTGAGRRKRHAEALARLVVKKLKLM